MRLNYTRQNPSFFGPVFGLTHLMTTDPVGQLALVGSADAFALQGRRDPNCSASADPRNFLNSSGPGRGPRSESMRQNSFFANDLIHDS